MRGLFNASIISAGLLLPSAGAQAAVQVAIDLTHQRMRVSGAERQYDWPISSARSGYYTPGGNFAPQRMELMHYSRAYHMSPMPHAIFFNGGYAIHGTYATGALGSPASHGCVRLSPGNAATLYSMVQREGARISISGRPPASAPFAEARRRSPTGYGVGSYAGYRAVARAQPVSYGYGGYGYGGYGYGYGGYGAF